MTKPTYEQALDGNIQWRREYRDINILISFHGYIAPEKRNYWDYGSGTWCYYLILDEQQFTEDQWKDLYFEGYESEYGWNYDYNRFPDIDFHHGITFYEQNQYYSRSARKFVRTVKAGCDYNHLWDRENGYSDNFDSVLFDAKKSVDRLMELYTITKKKCEWSGLWGDEEEYYIAKNGKNVHKKYIEYFEKDEIYKQYWLPKEGE